MDLRIVSRRFCWDRPLIFRYNTCINVRQNCDEKKENHQFGNVLIRHQILRTKTFWTWLVKGWLLTSVRRRNGCREEIAIAIWGISSVPNKNWSLKPTFERFIVFDRARATSDCVIEIERDFVTNNWWWNAWSISFNLALLSSCISWFHRARKCLSSLHRFAHASNPRTDASFTASFPHRSLTIGFHPSWEPF